MKSNTHIDHFVYTKIEYNTKWIKQDYEIRLFAWLIFEFTIYAIIVNSIVSEFVPPNFQDVVNVLFYIFLYMGICITAFFTKKAARSKNGNINVFTGKELEVIVWNALIATSVYYFVFGIRDHTTSFFSFAGLIVALLTGFLFSLGDGLSNDNIEGLLQYFKNTIKILLKNCMSLVTAASILSIVIVLAVDYMRQNLPSFIFNIFLISVGMLFAFLIVVYAICQIQKKSIIRRVVKYAIGKNLLILEYTPYGDIIRSIIRSLEHAGGKRKMFKSKSDIHKKHYDVIVIANYNFQGGRLLIEAKDYLCDGGILIAPAYTSNRRKQKCSRLLSPQDYLCQLNKFGWKATNHFTQKIAGITYAELKRTKL